jgi:hypothetical protein
MNMKTGDLFRGEMNVSVVTELKATYWKIRIVSSLQDQTAFWIG